MIAIKKVRKFIQDNPTHPAGLTLSALVRELETEGNIPVAQLYKLEHSYFLLALEILAEWRIDRYYCSKMRLLDLSVQLAELLDGDPSPVPSTPAN